MTSASRWKKAMLSSLFLHIILLIAAGGLLLQLLTAPPVEEPLLTLELEGASGGSPGPGGPPAPAPVAAPLVPQPVPPAPAPVIPDIPEPDPVEKPQPEAQPVVDSTSMAVVAAETAGSGGNEQGSGTGSGAGTGAGTGTGNEGSGTGRSGGIIAPGILSRAEPSYPESARQAGQQGSVVLKIQILTNGRPGEISVYQSSGYDLLDDAAIRAIAKWRFVPAKDRLTGQPIVCYTTMPVVFRLRS